MFEQRNETDYRACQWVVLMESGQLSPQQQLEFEAWLAASTRHEGAYRRASAASVHFERLGALGAGHRSSEPPPQLATRRRAIAAVLSVTTLVGIGTLLGEKWNSSARAGRYVTDTGEMRRIGLADGSEVVLNTASEILVAYTGTRRALHLVRGEALFTVAKDIARPFLLSVGQLMVRAIGTAFVIRRIDADIMHITVNEGTIEIQWSDGLNRELQRLSANHEATVGANGIVETHMVSSDERQRQLAWLSGDVIFNGQPLYQALREMNRYSRRRLVVEDSELSEKHIVGVFRVTDMDAFLSTLQQTLNVDPVPTGDSVLLRPRANSH